MAYGYFPQSKERTFTVIPVGDYTTATIQYIIDGVALVGHVGTIPEERGKFHARQLLY